MITRVPTGTEPGDEESPLAVTADEVSYIMELAREFEGKFAPSEGAGADLEDGDAADYMELHASDADTEALIAAIDNLDDDKQVDLVVLMWIGRGTFGADELDEARHIARTERTHKSSEYLLGEPMLADYLTDGFAAFGIDVG